MRNERIGFILLTILMLALAIFVRIKKEEKVPKKNPYQGFVID